MVCRRSRKKKQNKEHLSGAVIDWVPAFAGMTGVWAWLKGQEALKLVQDDEEMNETCSLDGRF